MKQMIMEIQVKVFDIEYTQRPGKLRHKNISIPLTLKEYQLAKRLGKTKGGFELFKLVIDRIRELQKDLSEEQQIDMNNIGGYRYAINVVSCEKCVEKSHCTCNNGITHIPFGEDNLL